MRSSTAAAPTKLAFAPLAARAAPHQNELLTGATSGRAHCVQKLTAVLCEDVTSSAAEAATELGRQQQKQRQRRLASDSLPPRPQVPNTPEALVRRPIQPSASRLLARACDRAGASTLFCVAKSPRQQQTQRGVIVGNPRVLFLDSEFRCMRRRMREPLSF